MIKILYVHGYNGQPHGDSFQKLAKYAAEADFGGEKVEMHSFDYDAAKPHSETRRLRLYYYENGIDLIIGASLGGFLAANCTCTRRLVVNPCWAPSAELPKLGYTGPMEDYEFIEKGLGRMAKYGDDKLCVGCFAQEDELLGTKYQAAFSKSFKETYDIPGGHHMSEEAAKMIMTEIAPALVARFSADVAQTELERLHHAHMYSIYNAPAIKKSDKCGCFYCGKVFPADTVTEYASELGMGDDTALCPYCMIDSVLADADWKDLSPAFLDKMTKYFF